MNAIVDAFFGGYAVALEFDDSAAIAARLTGVANPLRGFAYEGSAMALALLDRLWPVRPTRVRRLIDGAGNHHVYMVHVGAGWAAARLRRAPISARAGLDPVIDWLAVDGYGFHEGLFRTTAVVRHGTLPRGANGYTRRAFDQGLGRSLWFVESCDPERIAHTIAQFGTERRADLWSGVGLAATYAGGANVSDLRMLRRLAESYESNLAQGAVFAAEARARAENPVPHTEEACAVFAGLGAEAAAAIARQMREGLADSQSLPAYELWRRRVAGALAKRHL